MEYASDNIIKTAGIQLVACADKKETLKKAEHLIRISVENGAKIACLPQLFSLKWCFSSIDEKNRALAERENDVTIETLRETASRSKVVVIAPIFEIDGSDYYNTAFVIGTEGEIIGKYRKIHVPQIPLWEEKSYFKPGNLGLPVFKTAFATIGIQLCWDVFFPEGFRCLALKGAEVVFAPTASAFRHSRHKWERAIQAAAHANGIFIFRVNRVGKEDKLEFYGQSFLAGPDGEFTLKPAGSQEGVIIAETDLSLVNETRREWTFFKDRRPADYKTIIEE